MSLRSMLLAPVRRILRPVYSHLYAALEPRIDKHMRMLFERRLQVELNTISVAVEFVVFNQVPGDYLEFGVFRGRSFIQAYHQWHRQRDILLTSGAKDGLVFDYAKRDIRFFAFDSFEGLPAPHGLDDSPKTPEHWQKGTCDVGGKQNFLDILAAGAVDTSKVVAIAGWYDKTLTDQVKREHRIRKAAIVHVDCDFYESAVQVLEFVTDLIQDGTVIVFDDWFRFRNDRRLGERRACREWLERNPQLRLTELAKHRSHSIAFVVNVDAGAARVDAASEVPPRREA